jgi:folate-binding protein YgfZ
MTQPWLAPTAPDVVWFTGNDALRFLNDLISQEIGDMEVGETRRSFLLAPDGKLDHILWVTRTEDGHGLITDPGRGGDLASTLSRFRIRVDVEITEETRPVWLIMGEGDGFDVSWVNQPRRLVIGDRPDLPTGTEEDYERARIAAGEPFFGRDVTEKTIPHETGLVPQTVDFTKGCFLGQELVARIDSRGANVPRPLRLLEFEGNLKPADELTQDGKPVGLVTSVTYGLAIAVIARSVEPGSTLLAGDTLATVRELPTKVST